MVNEHGLEISNAAREMGRKGGQVKSERKAAAVRENGRRGGRPLSWQQKEILAAGIIEIVSGEGLTGTATTYTGKRTLRDVRARLTRERCGGDRWAIMKLDGRTLEDF